MPRRPIRVHTALAGWGVLAVGGDGGGGGSSVSGSRHAVLPVGVPVCADTRTPHTDSPHGLPTRDTASACVLICGVRDAHGVGARSSEREMTAETRPGALTHGSRVY
jgi:hypothetical protein